MNDDKLTRLEAIFKVANDGVASMKEVSEIAAAIIQAVKQMLTDFSQEIGGIRDTAKKGDDALHTRVDDTELLITKSQQEIERRIREIELTPGDPGKDADLEILKAMVLESIVLPEAEKSEVIPERTIEDIRDGLEELQGDDRLDVSAIKGIRKLISSLLETVRSTSYTGLLGVTQLIAGTNVTIDNSNPHYPVINALGGGSFSVLVPTGTVNGTNRTFVFGTAPQVVILDNGNIMNKVSSDGTINWTGTTTIVLAQAPNFNIFAF